MALTAARAVVSTLFAVRMAVALTASHSNRAPQRGPPPICAVADDTRKRITPIVHTMPKTGSTSIGVALELLGYADCGSRQIMGMESFDAVTQATNLVKAYPIGRVPQSVPNQVLEHLGFLKNDTSFRMQKYNWRTPDGRNEKRGHPRTNCESFSDFPLGHATGIDLRLKILLWPRAKYIWVDRPFESWKASYTDWTVWTTGHKPYCSEQFLRSYVDSRRQEILDLKAVAPEQVLLMNITDLTWDRLLGFLPVEPGCRPPTKEFPKVNEMPPEAKHEEAMISKSVHPILGPQCPQGQ